MTDSLTKISRVDQETDDPIVGDVVGGRYQLIEKIADGSFTQIFRALETDLSRYVALKIMTVDATSDPTLCERFRREALITSQLTHVGTITVYDYSETEDGIPFIAMEHLEGHDLDAEIQERGAISPPKVREIVVDVCRCLAEAHQQAIIHRDLKPDNIFLLTPGEPGPARIKLLDFGIAKATRALSGQSTFGMLTGEGLVVGTPLYMSPEQLIDDPLTPASDIYSLAHIMFEMLTGRHAFGDPSADVMQTMLAHIEEAMPNLPGPLEGHPLDEIVQRAASKNATDRYQDANELLEALQSPELIKTMRRWTREGRDTVAQPAPLALRMGRRALDAAPPAYRGEVQYVLDHLEMAFGARSGRILLLSSRLGAGNASISNILGSVRTALSDLADVQVVDRAQHQNKDVRLGGLWSDVSLLLELDEAKRPAAVRSSLQDHNIKPEQIQVLHDLLVYERDVFSQIGEIRGAHDQIYDAVSNLVLSVASERMLVWIIEDLHRTDPSTLAYLQHLKTLLDDQRCRLVVVGTYDPSLVVEGGAIQRTLQPLLSAAPPVVFRRQVGALDLDAARAAVAEHLDAPPSDELLSWVRDIAGSHGELIPEVIAHLRNEGRIEVSDGLSQLVRPEGEATLPPSLSDVVRRQIETRIGATARGDKVREILVAIAMLGREVPVALLRDFLDRLGDDTSNVAELIEDLVRAGTLTMSFETISFTAPLTREVLLEDLVTATRNSDTLGTEAQLKFGLAARCMMEATLEPGGDVLDHIVGSLLLARQPIEAVRLLRSTGDRLYRAFELEQAEDTYQRAYRLLQDVDPAEKHRLREELVTLLRLSEIYVTMTRPDAAEVHLAKAREASQRTADTKLSESVQARIFQLEGELALAASETEAASRLFRDARRGYELVGDDLGTARAMVEQARVLVELDRPEDAIDSLLEALVLGELIEAKSVQGQSKVYLAEAHLRLDELDKSLEYATDATELFESEANIPGLAVALAVLAPCQALCGSYDDARETLSHAITAAQRLADHTQLRELRRLQALLMVRAGELATAQGTLQPDISAMGDQQVLGDEMLTALIWGDILAAISFTFSSRSTQGSLRHRVEKMYRAVEDVALRQDQPLFVSRAVARRALFRSGILRFEQGEQILAKRVETLDVGAELAELRTHQLHIAGQTDPTEMVERLEDIIDVAATSGFVDAEIQARFYRARHHVELEQIKRARRQLAAARRRALKTSRLLSAIHLDIELKGLGEDTKPQGWPLLPIPIPLPF